MLLLDTHVLLWYLQDSPHLTGPARAAIDHPETPVFASAASAWEMSIKHAQGRLHVPDDLEAALSASGISALHISVAHGLAAGRLPRHHGDPFDRLLIAQAQLEDLTVVTHDQQFAPYGVPILWT